MNIKEALKLIQHYQDWRTGKDERTMDDAGINVREITLALDVLIRYAEEKQKEYKSRTGEQ